MPEPIRRAEPPRPRAFRLRWNSRKTPDSLNRYEWHEAQGVRFTSHDALVQVALSNGLVFETQGQMEAMLARGGDYSIIWQQDEQA